MKKNIDQPRESERGALLATVIIAIMMLSMILFAIIQLAQGNLARAVSRLYSLQTQYAAETGADIALTRLNHMTTQVTTEQVMERNDRYKATYEVKVEDSPTGNMDEKIITSTGRVYTPASAAKAGYERTVRVVARRSSTNASSSLLSKDIIQVSSSVKDIVAKSIYVNKYIQLDKNGNVLTAEKITVAGTKAGADNCSILGSKTNAGELKPPVGYAPKVELDLRGKNCVTLNPSSAFNVNINNVNLEPVASTYIPWNWTMGTGFMNANSCADWGSGSGTHNLPSNPSLKKSHYPDSSSGITSSCGTSGTINLGTGTYNLLTDVHVRANLCNNSMGCEPTFNNPNPSQTRYVYVEGTINFGVLTTTPGSGPIVFIAYGGDAADVAGVCPLGPGASIFLGKGGSNSTNAPQAYLLAVNGGLCIDKAKFGSYGALGGMSGKTLFFGSNSGNPFSLQLNSSFPLDAVPVNLSWKAAEYSRVY